MPCFQRLTQNLLNFFYSNSKEEKTGILSETKTYTFVDELFGPGLSNIQVEFGAKRHISSSTEDLKILLNQERNLISSLKNYKSDKLVISYFKEIGDIDAIER